MMELVDKIINSSEIMKIPIMVNTEEEKTLIEERAIKIKADIPHPVISRDVCCAKYKDRPPKVIFYNIDSVLKRILLSYYGTQVVCGVVNNAIINFD